MGHRVVRKIETYSKLWEISHKALNFLKRRVKRKSNPKIKAGISDISKSLAIFTQTYKCAQSTREQEVAFPFVSSSSSPSSWQFPSGRSIVPSVANSVRFLPPRFTRQ